MRKEKGALWDPFTANGGITNGANGTNGHANGSVNVPKVKDVIGEALDKVGPYKKLDNTKQVVALIDDVR